MFSKYLSKKRPVWVITLLISLFITAFGNLSFWKGIATSVTFKDAPFLFIAFFIIIWALTNLILTLVSFKPIFKGVAFVILIASASAAYFMDNYAVMIDRGMIQNVFATDMNEATELFSLRLVATILLLGVLPLWLVYKVNIAYKPFLKGLLQKVMVIMLCLGVIGGTLYSNYQELIFFGREHRELRHLMNPVNYISSIESIIRHKLKSGKIIVKAIETDAKKRLAPEQRQKPALIILLLGETTRAMNFSLNGYARNTNPELSKQDIINFKDVTSCGTATAVSVPCMFSRFSRDEYSDEKGEQFENLLDVANHANYDVLWRDNNTGCQNTCKRIEFEDLAHSDNEAFCKGGNCIDEILLDDLQQVVDTEKEAESKDKFIILHPKGNHGPTYHRRYPERFEVFKPACKTNQLQSCTEEEVVNAYDNAVLYADFITSETINFLKKNSEKYDTAMLYMSDHGESLGENNLYLHGLPYMVAPEQQKKVPFVLWLSAGYQQTYGVDKACVVKKAHAKLSHDNLFSSMLGLLAIDTDVHEKNLDIFSTCTTLPAVN